MGLNINSEAMKIRKAETSDIDSVAALVRELSLYYLEDGQGELPGWFRATLTNSAFAGRFNDPEYFNFVAVIDGSVGGYVSIRRGFHLYHLFVSARLHNQGIAKLLWRHCVEQLKIEQCTVRSSLFAVPIYSKLGFIVSGNSDYKDGIGFQPMVYKSASC